MVHRSPQWASGSNSTYAPPQDPETYAAFMRFLAARYSGRVAAWEIWNEPNTDRFWPTGPNATEYVSLLRAAYGAVKEADPAAQVVFGGLSQNDYSFVEAAYDAGAKNWFDVMSVHPYPGPHPPEHSSSWGGRISPNVFTGYREVRASMLAQNDDKPIWLTEFGWSTTTTDPWGVTPAQQADYLRRAYCVLEQDPYVEVAAWYNLRNNHWNADADEWESQLGLVKSTFERKPSYDAYKGYDPQACLRLTSRQIPSAPPVGGPSGAATPQPGSRGWRGADERSAPPRFAAPVGPPSACRERPPDDRCSHCSGGDWKRSRRGHVRLVQAPVHGAHSRRQDPGERTPAGWPRHLGGRGRARVRGGRRVPCTVGDSARGLEGGAHEGPARRPRQRSFGAPGVQRDGGGRRARLG